MVQNINGGFSGNMWPLNIGTTQSPRWNISRAQEAYSASSMSQSAGPAEIDEENHDRRRHDPKLVPHLLAHFVGFLAGTDLDTTSRTV